jgi:hypothetical protein
MRSVENAVAALARMALVLLLVAGTAQAASEFVGTWKLTDTKGEPFQITLSEGGQARGRHIDKEMKGSWTEEEGTATITWATGWYTKISKDGNGYKKSAYKGSLDSSPISTSAAVKVD